MWKADSGGGEGRGGSREVREEGGGGGGAVASREPPRFSKPLLGQKAGPHLTSGGPAHLGSTPQLSGWPHSQQVSAAKQSLGMRSLDLCPPEG